MSGGNSPLISRPSIGKDLVDQAALSIMNGTHENLAERVNGTHEHRQFRIDTWSSPFRVTAGYLNVGRRHLVGPLQEVVVEVTVVLRHRPALTLWSLATRDLHLRVRRSGHTVPAPLEREAGYYFSSAGRGRLQAWLESVGQVELPQQLVRQQFASRMRLRDTTTGRT
jgi:hypothetical protein